MALLLARDDLRPSQAYDWFGEFEPSLQVNVDRIPLQSALRSLDLFEKHVRPRLEAKHGSRPRTAVAARG